jgi:hypothetical protein
MFVGDVGTTRNLDDIGAVGGRHKIKGKLVFLGKCKRLLCHGIVHYLKWEVCKFRIMLPFAPTVNLVGDNNARDVGPVLAKLL